MEKFATLLVVTTIGCVHTIPESEIEKFLHQSSYRPDGITDITGKYERSSGLDGERLELFSDGTFFYDSWTDVWYPNDPIKGYKGVFHLSGDSLVFVMNEIVYKDTAMASQARTNAEKVNAQIYFSRWQQNYSPAFVIRVNEGIFILRTLERKYLRTTFSTVEDITLYRTLNGKKFGVHLLMKTE